MLVSVFKMTGRRGHVSVHLAFRLLGTRPGPVTDGTFAEADANVSIQGRMSRTVKVFSHSYQAQEQGQNE